MATEMVKGAFHFSIDPAKMAIGSFEVPETLQLTLSVGAEVVPLKVSRNCLPAEAMEALDRLVENAIIKAKKVATPIEKNTDESSAEETAPVLKAKDAKLSLF